VCRARAEGVGTHRIDILEDLVRGELLDAAQEGDEERV
jgi:hypothetical protein